MVLSFEAAVRSLGDSAEQRAHDPRLSDRLENVQSLLREELSYVEQALIDVVGRGGPPGRDAARHLVSQGGKRIRPMALLLSSACFDGISPVATELAVAAELIHSATLLHDDVIDDGMVRRGVPTARRVWGNAVSVLAGDLLLVEALDRTEQHAPSLLPSLIRTLRQLVDGEITQLAGRRRLEVSRDVYQRILRGKTASLFRWATRTGATLGGADEAAQEDFAKVGELIGMAFQLVDDALDYSSVATAKTRLGDLREGKLTLPLVLCVEKQPSLMDRVMAIHSGDDSALEEVGRRVVACGACEEVRALAAAHTSEAIEILRRAPDTEARTLLEKVATHLCRRDG